MRTILSLLGITIGIFCIITIMSAIDSMKESVSSSIESLGGEVVLIDKFPWEMEMGIEYPWWKYINRPTPKYIEFKQLQESSLIAKHIAFSASISVTLSYKGNSLNGYEEKFISSDYNKLQNFEIQEGRYFFPLESNNGSNVAIIGDNIAKELFQGESAIGKEIKADGQKLTIIGVLQKEGDETMNTNDYSIFVPLSFAKSIYNINNCNPVIYAIAKDSYSIDDLIDELRVLMRGIRRLSVFDEDNFAINQSSFLTKFMDSVFSVLNAVGIIIGGFSILVGGFGIANIMFISVKERTKEIGIQKAIGAKFYFILIQFLSESIVLCISGGVVGLILAAILMKFASYTINFALNLSIANVFIGLAISCVVGFISGIIPAWKAASLNPVVAINKN